MKNPIFYLLTLCILFAFTYTSNIPEYYSIDSDYSVVIKGTSNVHDWQSTVEEMKSDVEVSVDGEGILQIRSCELSIPVKSIKSEKGSIMDKKTRKAMKESEYPNVNFRLTGFNAVDLSRKNFESTVKGDLRIAGVTNPIEFDVKGTYSSSNNIEIKGSHDLKMTDYGIDPPVALLGAMKTGDDVTVEFKINLKAD